MNEDFKQDPMFRNYNFKIADITFFAPPATILYNELDRLIVERRPSFVCFCDGHLHPKAYEDTKILDILKKAELVLPDGTSLIVASRLLGFKGMNRLQGPHIMKEYLKHSVPKGFKHFLYGGHDGIPEKLSQILTREIPGLKIVGTYSPPFRDLTESEEAIVKKMIEDSGADVLWVGLGAPKQEQWMERHIGSIDVPLMLGVGAAFDFHSGQRKRAPKIFQCLGIEWFFRMITGGKRVFFRNLKYVTLNLFILLREIIKNK